MKMAAAPDADMMAVAERLAQYLESGAKGEPEHIFADNGVTIIENFAPYVFAGPDAVGRWAEAMRTHLSGVTGLRHTFEEVHDFSRAGEQAYFALTTGWTGKTKGRPFHETGGWALVLTAASGKWRIKAYGWSVVG